MSKQLKYFFSTTLVLKGNTNQANGLANYAVKFLAQGNPGPKVLKRTKLFHIDSVITGLSAIALKTNAPTVLR
jgi:2-methylcitrate dehydratase